MLHPQPDGYALAAVRIVAQRRLCPHRLGHLGDGHLQTGGILTLQDLNQQGNLPVSAQLEHDRSLTPDRYVGDPPRGPARAVARTVFPCVYCTSSPTCCALSEIWPFLRPAQGQEYVLYPAVAYPWSHRKMLKARRRSLWSRTLTPKVRSVCPHAVD